MSLDSTDLGLDFETSNGYYIVSASTFRRAPGNPLWDLQIDENHLKMMQKNMQTA